MHLAEENLPDAYAIVNPNRQDEMGEFKYLCAAGMVFILLVEANTQLKNNNVKSPNLLESLTGAVCSLSRYNIFFGSGLV